MANDVASTLSMPTATGPRLPRNPANTMRRCIVARSGRRGLQLAPASARPRLAVPPRASTCYDAPDGGRVTPFPWPVECMTAGGVRMHLRMAGKARGLTSTIVAGDPSRDPSAYGGHDPTMCCALRREIYEVTGVAFRASCVQVLRSASYHAHPAIQPTIRSSPSDFQSIARLLSVVTSSNPISAL